MSDRIKLVELIKSAKAAMRGKEFICNLERECFMAEYLIAHGVTVRQMQKPLTVEELKEHMDKVVHLEYAGNKMEEHPVLLVQLRMFYAEFEMYGAYDSSEFILDDYGKTWRCWADRPTDEERMAAAWL